MPAAAIPALITAGGAIGSTLLGRKAASGATRMSNEESAALTSQTRAANTLQDQSSSLFRTALPQIQQGSRYFSALAGGNRSVMQQTLAPEVEGINATYGGTRRSLARFLRGPDRDYQMGELERERAGKVASLFRDVRGNANQRLLEHGDQLMGIGQAGVGTAAGIQSGAQNSLFRNRMAGAQMEEQAGSDMGSLFFELLKSYGGGGAKAGTPKLLPSRQTVSPIGSLAGG